VSRLTTALKNMSVRLRAVFSRHRELAGASEARRREAEALAAVSHAVAEALDVSVVAQRVADHLRELLGVQGASVFRIDEESGNLVVLAASGTAARMAPGTVFPPGAGMVSRAVAGRTALSTPDVRSDGRVRMTEEFRRNVEQLGYAAVLAVPLLARGEVIGAIAVIDQAGRRFSDETVHLVHAFADHAGLGLYNSGLFERLNAANARLQALSRRLMEVREAEDRRLAAELHDEIGQLITALRMSLEALHASAPADVQSRAKECIALVDEALSRVRNLSLSLRPSILDDLGLAAALRWHVGREAARGGLTAHVDVVELEDVRFAPHLEVTCFRIAQEAVTNTLRHAAAREIRVRLRRRPLGVLEMSVSDDGVGFDVAAARGHARSGGSVGLLGMEERAALVSGHIEISSSPGEGTLIVAFLPETPADEVAAHATTPDGKARPPHP
jgi:signal transduction histidine kinase